MADKFKPLIPSLANEDKLPNKGTPEGAVFLFGRVAASGTGAYLVWLFMKDVPSVSKNKAVLYSAVVGGAVFLGALWDGLWSWFGGLVSSFFSYVTI